MNGALSLAASIAAMDQQGLERLVTGRRLLSPSSIDEPLGLAIELLKPDSVSRALQGLHRDLLTTLLRLSSREAAAQGEGLSSEEDPEALRGLAGLGLIGLNPDTGEFVALSELDEHLDEQLRERLAGLGDVASPAGAEGADAVPSPDTSAWYGAALTSVRRAAQLLRTFAKRPVKLGRKGHPPVNAVRELAEAVHCEPEPIDRLIDVLRSARLLVAFRDHGAAEFLGISGDARIWLGLDYPHRWISLATSSATLFDARLLQSVSESNGNLTRAVQRIPVDYPLLSVTEIEGYERVAATVEDLGLTVHGTLTPAASALLENGDDEAALEIAELDFPPPAAGIYLQPDLSLIAPGPLLPEDEAAISAIADTEQLGAAATFRLSAGTLARAARHGIAPGEVRTLLQRLSLTGIPQPLEYLLRDLERKLAEGPAVATQVEWRYEVGEQDVHLASPAAFDAQEDLPQTEVSAMIDRILVAEQEFGGEGDLMRRLKLAIRVKQAVRVTAVAGADEREFLLLPVSLQNGRLRATDQQAGVERTLPISAISAVEAA